MKLNKYKLGKLIEWSDERNDNLEYGLSNVKGISIFITACIIVIVMIIVLLKLIEPKDPVINQELSSGGVKYEFNSG